MGTGPTLIGSRLWGLRLPCPKDCRAVQGLAWAMVQFNPTQPGRLDLEIASLTLRAAPSHAPGRGREHDTAGPSRLGTSLWTSSS